MDNSKVNNKGLIFVISGPSGSGKTTLVGKLIKERGLKNRLVKSISFTTRPKRSGERNNKDYLFVSEKVFKERLKAKKFLEWTRYLGYYYATPKDFAKHQLKKGRHIILCLDLKGAFRIRQLYPERTVTIFVAPPSLKALKHRIGARCSKTKKEEVRQRLKLASRELLACRRYDYCLVNNNLRQTKEKLQEIILKHIIRHT